MCCSLDFCLSFKFIVGFGLGVTLCFLVFFVIYTQDNSLFVKIMQNHTL